MATTRRQKRINELLRQELGTLILKEAKDPRLAGVTVTEVKISPDLGHARVYVSLIGDEEEQAEALEGLKRASGFLKHEIGERLDLRRVPDFSFHFDESIQRGQRILNILHELEQENEETPGEAEDT